MKSRGGLVFRPGVAGLIGMDVLEYRQLLSTVGQVVEGAEVDRTRTVEISAPVAGSDAPTSDATAASSTQAEATAGTFQEAGSSQVSPVSGAPSVASLASSGGDAATDAGGSVTHAAAAVVPTASATVAPASSASGQSGSAEETPADEAATTSSGNPLGADQPGEVVPTIAVGVTPGASAEDATSVVPSGQPSAFMAPRSGSSANGDNGARQANVGPSAIEAGAAGALLTTDVAAADGVVAVPTKVRLITGSDIPQEGAQPLVDVEIIEARAVEVPAPLSCADLLTEFLPSGRARLEEAIDRFLAPLEDLGTELANWSPSTSSLAAATMIATAALATEIVRRRIRGGQAAEEEGDEDLGRFSGYPSAWRIGEA